MNTFSNAWNNVKNSTVNACNNLKTSVSNKVTEIKNAISNKFNEIINSAKNWGKNLIQGFIDGIKSMIDKVKNAVSSVVNAVAKFLGFHSPAEEGEGQHIIEWGENMIQGFMDGIDNKSKALKEKMASMISAPDLSSKVDIGLQSINSKSAGTQGNTTTTNNNTTTNNSNFTLRIDKFVNEREQDIERLVEEIEFYRQKQLTAKGGTV